MSNPVIHFELSGEDGVKLSQFYRDVFEWKIEYNTHNIYSVESVLQNGIDGHIFTTTDEDCSTNGLTIYVQVEDLKKTLSMAEELGGQILVQPRLIPSGAGAFALFIDPSGNCIGLYKPKLGDQDIGESQFDQSH